LTATARTANPGEDAESGRGLLLVEAISERWGFFGYDGGGKVTWALLEAAPAASSDPAARFMTLAHAWPERTRHLASGRAGPDMPYADARQ
jgi:hypothetical protein